jgi:hypothetical protein
LTVGTQPGPLLAQLVQQAGFTAQPVDTSQI